jgi:phospholipid transport system transporter-binding protein
MNEIVFQQNNQRVFFQGDLTRETIDQRFEKNTRLLLQTSPIELDLVAVSRIDTAGLAWLLMMVEQAQHSSCQLAIQNAPEDLLSLAKLSAVDCFLPID